MQRRNYARCRSRRPAPRKDGAVRLEKIDHLAASIFTTPGPHPDDLVPARLTLAEIDDGLRFAAADVDTGNQGAAGVLNRVFAGARSARSSQTILMSAFCA